MNILESLKQPYSKTRIAKIVNFVGDSQEYFDELISCLGNENIKVDVVTWTMSYCVENHPKLVEKHYDFIINQLKTTQSQAVERNLFRLLQFVDIPEKYQGEITNLTFKCVELGNKSGVANKVFAITILHNISQKQPEIKNELKILIEDQLPYASAGFQSRGRKILKKIL